jgi:hypothetical protein
MVFEVVYGVEGVARVDVFTHVAPPGGDVHGRPAQLGWAVRDGPHGPSAASCATVSLTARNSGTAELPGESLSRREHVSHGRESEPARSPMPDAARIQRAARHEPPSTSTLLVC